MKYFLAIIIILIAIYNQKKNNNTEKINYKYFFKKLINNIKNMKIKSVEGIIFLLSAIFTLLLLINYKCNIILYIFIPQYFYWKTFIQIVKEKTIALKYKGISNMFDNRVKVIEVTEDSYKLYSFIPISYIEKKKEDLEFFFNKKIESIKAERGNLKMINLNIENNKKQDNLNKILLFEEYLPKIPKKKNYDLQFTVGVDKKDYLIFDLAKLIHVFIAGTAGGGKSNLLNVLIQSLMYFNNQIAFIMADFKGGIELNQYSKFKNTIIVEETKSFLIELGKINDEMESRYVLLKDNNFKKIQQYNQMSNKKLPYIVLIIDEMSDIRLEGGNEGIEILLTRILNKGRAAGIFVIGATQRPSGVQLSTEIRDRFDTKISARIKDKRTQQMAGIKGTENLKVGQFLIDTEDYTNKFKAFFIDEIKHNKVYEDLTKKLTGGVNFDKDDC